MKESTLTANSPDISVACLTENLPYSASARAFVEAASRFQGRTAWERACQTLLCCEIFHATERILKTSENPIPPFIRLLERHTALLETLPESGSNADALPSGENFDSVEQETGSHYGNLFREFQHKDYYEEALSLLKTRFERNDFDFSFTTGKKALDMGCGGGRYTVALKNLGFEDVTGVDISETGIQHARERLSALPCSGVHFEQASVLSLPFPDHTFDFVFSNGVLHHTVNMTQGIRELLRVLKPGGRGFLYLIEAPGGIFWDIIEILRVLMKQVPASFARKQFELLGVPPNRRYYILDHILVPINIRSTPRQVENLLSQAGASQITRLKRGTDFDRAEQIFQKHPYAREKFGAGENRYFFQKPRA